MTKSAGIASLTAVTEVYADGQRVIRAAVEYTRELAADAVRPEDYEVAGRTVMDARVSDCMREDATPRGHYVVLTLNPREAASRTCEATGSGPFTRLKVHPARVTVSQKRDLAAADGTLLPAFRGLESDKVNNGVVDEFIRQKFAVPGTTHTLEYNLFAPRHLVPGQKYPLVVFLHDAGTCSNEAEAPLVQGTGAVVFAREAEFGRRPCFVVAPHYETVCADDDFHVAWQADATAALVRALTKAYPVDKTRIYGTGQSMGCMMLCELLVRNPGFFAGTLLVAGQWDPARMAAAHSENIWAVVSAGDRKAFPIMGACMDAMEQAGGCVSRSYLDAQADASLLDAQIRFQKQRACNLNFTWFEGDSVIPEGMEPNPGLHHVSTWAKAYDIKALREWLFEQRLPPAAQRKKSARGV